MFKNFMNFDTGEFWQIDDLALTYNQFDEGEHDTFDDFLADLMEQGMLRTGGLVPAYIVTHVGGENDGDVVFCTEDEDDAINFARDYNEQHEDDADYLGVSIFDPEDIEVLNWT